MTTITRTGPAVPFPDGSIVQGDQVFMVENNTYTRRRIKEGDLIKVQQRPKTLKKEPKKDKQKQENK